MRLNLPYLTCFRHVLMGTVMSSVSGSRRWPVAGVIAGWRRASVWLRALVTAASLSVLLAACGGGSSDPASEAVPSVSADIGASGGTLDLQSLGLTLPPGAVSAAVNLSMSSLDAGTGEFARFRLSPAGLALEAPAELRFTRSGMPATTRFFWDVNGELRLIPSSLSGDVLTAQIDSLGLSAAGGVLRAQSAALPARLQAQAADAAVEGGTVVVKPMDCATQIPQMAARLQIVAAGRDQELTIRFYDELVAARQICLEAEVQALKDRSCDALETAQFRAQTLLADSFTTFQELTLPLLAAEAFVQETGADCATADSTQVGPLIAGKFDQVLQVLQSQQLRGGFAEAATARDLQVLLSYKGSCDQLDLGTICDRLNDEIIPNLFDGMRVGAFNECRSSGSALVLSQLHFLGTSVTDTRQFLGFGRFGPADIEADMTYCTDPSLNLRVFSDAAGIPTELTDRAATLRPLVGLGNYPRSTTVEVPRDGSLTVSGEVAALRCADGSASTADLVARIGNREVARRRVGGNGYPLTTAPLDLVVSQLLAAAALDPVATNAFTVLINREGGQCPGALGPTLNGARTLFEIRVNLPPETVAPGLFRGPVMLQVTEVQAGFQRQTETLSYRIAVTVNAELEQVPFGGVQFNRVMAQVDSVVSVLDRRVLGDGGTCSFTRTDERVVTARGSVEVPTLFPNASFEIDRTRAVVRLGFFALQLPLQSQVVETRRFTNVHPSCTGIDFTTTTASSTMDGPYLVTFFYSNPSNGQSLAAPIVTDSAGLSTVDVTDSRTLNGGDGQSFQTTSVTMRLADQ